MWWLAAAFVLFVVWFCWQLFGPNPPIVVSKQTTYITAPLRPDGLPDYQKYVRDKLREGVTPENNAAVLMWQATGPGDLKPNEQAAVAKELGISLPLRDRTLAPLFGETNRKLVAKLLTDRHSIPVSDSDDIVFDAIDVAMSAPWSSDQFPPIAAWIEENQHQLDLLVGASTRDRYYFPSASLLDNPTDGNWFYSLYVGVSLARDASRVLRARAMWNLGENRHEAAWQDLLAIHHLARLVSQNETTIDQLVAVAIDGIALEATQTLLADERLSASLARQIQNDLNALPPTARFAEAFDGLERIWFLAIVPYAAESGAGSYLTTMTGDSEPAFHPLDHVAVDWNVTLRLANQWYDRLAAVFNEPNNVKRKQAIAKVEAELAQLSSQSQEPSTWAASAISPYRRSNLVAAAMIVNTTSAIDALAAAMDRANTQLEITRLAAALAVYRTGHGQYPDKLEQLVPDIPAQLPVDLYHAKPFIYHPDGEGYLLYSTGPNGIDGGGSHEQWEIAAARAGIVRRGSRGTPAR